MFQSFNCFLCRLIMLFFLFHFSFFIITCLLEPLYWCSSTVLMFIWKLIKVCLFCFNKTFNWPPKYNSVSYTESFIIDLCYFGLLQQLSYFICFVNWINCLMHSFILGMLSTLTSKYLLSIYFYLFPSLCNESAYILRVYILQMQTFTHFSSKALFPCGNYIINFKVYIILHTHGQSFLSESIIFYYFFQCTFSISSHSHSLLLKQLIMIV